MICDVCNQQTLKELTKDTQGNTFYYCIECDFVTSNPKQTLEKNKEFYQGFNKKQGKTVNTNLIIKTIEILTGKKKENIKLLDYGAGIGENTNAFSKLVETHYFDIDENAKKQTLKDYPQIKLMEENGKYDAIFCGQVIEHTPNPNTIVNEMKEKLKPNGVIIVTTPNQKTLEWIARPRWALKYILKAKTPLKFFKKQWLCLDPPRHYHAFNEKSLKLLFEKNGLTPKFLFTEYSHLTQFDLSHNIDMKFYSIKSVPRLVLNSIKLSLLTIMAILDKHKTFGENLVIIAQKQVGFN